MMAQTTFWFPSDPVPGCPSHSARYAFQHICNGVAAVDRLRILVVEDHPDAAATLVTLIRLWGHDVRAAHDGLSALEVAQAFSPDVVLLDIGLPGMDGWQVAERLCQQPAPKRPLLIAVTGYGQDADRRRSQEAGIDLHLVKPVDPDQLRRVLAPPADPSR
jgi:two-component system CheB/CheR fusion protein